MSIVSAGFARHRPGNPFGPGRLGGDRAANRTLYLIAVVRLRYCERTRAYTARRTAEGKTKKETIRCLKRYIAREVYHTLSADLKDLASTT